MKCLRWQVDKRTARRSIRGVERGLQGRSFARPLTVLIALALGLSGVLVRQPLATLSGVAHAFYIHPPLTDNRSGGTVANNLRQFWAGWPINYDPPTSGRVVPNPRITNLFWDNAWDSDSQYESAANVNAWTQSLVNSSYFDGAAQYGVGKASLTSHPSFTTASMGAGCKNGAKAGDSINDGDIRQWVECMAQYAHDHHVLPIDNNTIFVVYLPANSWVSETVLSHWHVMQACSDYDAYHIFGNVTTAWKTNWLGQREAAAKQTFAYAVVPTYCFGVHLPAGGDYMHLVSSNVSHELIESATDPIPGMGWGDDDAFHSGYNGWEGAYSDVLNFLTDGEAADPMQCQDQDFVINGVGVDLPVAGGGVRHVDEPVAEYWWNSAQGEGACIGTPPDRPANVHAADGYGSPYSSVPLSWDAPSNHGSPIVRYHIYVCDPSGNNCTDVDSAYSTKWIVTVPHGQYTFRVAAENASGLGRWSFSASNVATAASPQAPNAPGSAGSPKAWDHAITVSWTTPSGYIGPPVNDYTLTITDGHGYNPAPIDRPALDPNTYTFSALPNFTSYTITITPHNGIDGSQPLIIPNVYLAGPNASPDPPSNVRVKAGNRSLAVTWNRPLAPSNPPVDYYLLTCSTSSGFKKTMTIYDAAYPNLNGTFTGLQNGTQYTVSIASHDADGLGRAVSVNAVPNAPPGPPEGPVPPLSFSFGDGSLRVVWQPTANDHGSPVDYYTATLRDATTLKVLQKQNNMGTEVTFHGLTNGARYIVTVTAHNAYGYGGEVTTSVTLVPPPMAPEHPNNLHLAGIGRTTLSVTWSAPTYNGTSPLDKYLVELRDYRTLTVVAQQAITNLSSPKASFTSLTAGQKYMITVYSHNVAGYGGSIMTAVTLLPPLDAPTNLVASPGDHSATVSFGPPAVTGGTAVSSYTVRLTGPGYATSQTVSNLSHLVTTFSGLNNGVTYTVQVTAQNSQGLGATAATTVMPRAVPGSPTGLRTSAGPGSATVSWVKPLSDGSSAVTGYVVTITDGASYIRTQVTSSLSATFTGLSVGTRYQFLVAAGNAAGTGVGILSSPFLVTLSGPVSYEAESSTNTLAGGAAVNPCSFCSGGQYVRFLGYSGTLTFNGIKVNTGGAYKLTITYVNGDPYRAACIGINLTTPPVTNMRPPSCGQDTYINFPGTGWDHVETYTVSVQLRAGANSIAYYSPFGWAPDVDMITLSQ